MEVSICGYPDYLVNDNGQIFSKKSNRYLKPNTNKQGYLSIELFRDGKSKRMLIHRIVANAFLQNNDNLPQVNHKDENKQNNNLSNLEWCSAKYNMNYGTGAKTRHLNIDYSKPIYKENAIKNGKKVSKATVQFDADGNKIARYDSAKDASRATGLSHSHIIECCNGKRYKKVGGFIWRYERGSDLSGFQF